jgi:hypothetical protein
VTGHAAMSAAGARSGLRVIDGGALLTDPVKRLHRFQGEYTEVRFTAPHMGGRGRYIAVIPAGAIPGEPREVTITSADLTGLMDQLDDLLPPGQGTPGQQPT